MKVGLGTHFNALVGAGATFDPAKVYRYVLWRNFIITPKYACLWIMLNPSTADEHQDDPTIRRCQQFSRQWGFDSCRVVNLFAFRSTNPAALPLVTDPVGPQNDAYLQREAVAASKIICAWGVRGTLGGRSASIRTLLSGIESWCFGMTKGGEPLHPLYQPATRTLARW